MRKPLLTELAASTDAGSYFPGPERGPSECLQQVPAALRRAAPPALPGLAEATLRSHFADLAGLPHSPWLGAAAAARAAGLPGLSALHPSQPPPTVQGALEIIHEVTRALAALTGMDRFSLQPSSVREAERAALRLALASFARTQPGRNEVVAPTGSSALAQAREMGLVARPVPRLASGDADVDALEATTGPATVAVVVGWLTPAGHFERGLAAIGQVAHVHGARLAADATGLKRLAGHARLREAEADIAWLSLGELCPVATSAALGVRSALTECLPGPLVSKERGGYGLDDELPNTIGPLGPTAARLADALPVYIALRTLGEQGLARRALACSTGRV